MCTIAVIKIFKSSKQHCCRVFKLNKSHQSINIFNTIVNIVEKKLKETISLSTYIDKKVFDDLGLIVAPVYVLDVKKVGKTHVDLFLSSLKNIKQKFNLVLINCNNLFVSENSNIKLVMIGENKLNYKIMSLLNSLNVNKQFISRHDNISYNFDLNNFQLDTYNFIAKADLHSKGVYKLELPHACYGYIINNKNTGQICDAFGNIITEIKERVSVKIYGSVLYFKVNRPTMLTFKLFYEEQVKYNISLFNFDIELNGYTEMIKTLKQKAKLELENNPFTATCCSNINAKSLPNFLKLTILRKQYLNDYLNLIKNIFGLSLSNGILNVKPCEFIKQDFCIKYSLNDKEFSVNYTFSTSDKVKLYYVGHKIGTKENFVYGF